MLTSKFEKLVNAYWLAVDLEYWSVIPGIKKQLFALGAKYESGRWYYEIQE